MAKAKKAAKKSTKKTAKKTTKKTASTKKAVTKKAVKKPAAKTKKAAKKVEKKAATKESAKKTTTKKAAKKTAAKKAATKSAPQPSSKKTKKAAEKIATPESKEPTGKTLAKVDEITSANDKAERVQKLAEAMNGSPRAKAVEAAEILHAMVDSHAALLVPHVAAFAEGLSVRNKRVVQTCADALPAIAKVAPAKVAKHLDTLKDAFEPTMIDGKDGLVRTFSNLCSASVAYQKRLEPSLTLALETAKVTHLERWASTILPALKGEPHARARTVVEHRLNRIPRSQAQAIASAINFDLRIRYH